MADIILNVSVLLISVILCLLILWNKKKIFSAKVLKLQTNNEDLKETLKNIKATNEKLLNEAETIKETSKNLVVKINREINTCVNSIIGMANLLKDTDLQTEQKKNISAIITCSESLLCSANSIFNLNGNHKNILEKKIRMNDKSASKKPILPVSPEFAKALPVKILIAEDDLINQHLALKMLNKLGYNPDIVSNGKEALEVVGEKHYDVILMDGLMPEMDGFEATKMIRLCLENQPVIIALTASTMFGDKEKCIQAGMNDYISKPIDLNELAAMIEKWATKNMSVQ